MSICYSLDEICISIFLLDFTVFSFFFSFQCVVGLLIINTVINYGPPAWWTFSFSGDLPSYILCDYYECFDLWQINWWWWWWGRPTFWRTWRVHAFRRLMLPLRTAPIWNRLSLSLRDPGVTWRQFRKQLKGHLLFEWRLETATNWLCI